MRIGSLCTGYDGIALAIQSVLGGDVVWTSDIDKGACKIIAHRYPDAPNLGDLTVLDWTAVEEVDVLCAGYPCQPFSHAGRRKGTNDERHLWPYVREAIRVLRPRLTLLENVAGHRSLGFDRVLGDLAEDGMHVRWTSLRAADIGAPHNRERLFILVAPEPADLGHEWGWSARNGRTGSTDGGLLPTPRATDGTKGGPNQRGSSGDLMLPSAVALLPTPTSMDSKASGGGYNGQTNGRGGMLLPTPRVTQAGYADDGRGGKSLDVEARSDRWGDYAAAIARWEHILGRPAPEPTQTSSKGNPQLSPAFVEWMMGLPAGWVTDVPGITRNEALKALGNGVVPQQAAEALRVMASWTAVAA